ncbi:hypothetical protein BSLG_005630 [Batrachochytrium salamandrivorans]|nr:hypothetical protein BSLG_005630 [Batrachochytrium salamandrivorans]
MGYRHPAQLLYTRESDYSPHQAGTALSQFGHVSRNASISPDPSLHLDYEEKQWRIQHAEMLKQTAQQNQQRQSKVVNKQRDRGRMIPYLQDENIIQEGYPLMQPSFSQNMTESNWDTVSQPAFNEIYSSVELASTYDEPSKVVASTPVGMTRSAKEMAHEKYLHRLSTPTTSRQSKTTLERYKSDHPDTLHGRHMGDSNKSSSSLPIAVNYIPYTHSEYRQLKSRDSHMHLPKGLGRNDDEEWKTQYDKRMRMHEYSELIRQRERESGRNDGMFDTIPHDVISFSNDDSLKHDQYRPRRKLSVVFSDDMVMKESVPTYRNRKVLADINLLRQYIHVLTVAILPQ